LRVESKSNMNKELTKQYITLRVLIGYLGEKSQCNWWDTNFLSPVGLQFLAINFPRSSFVAGITSVSEAARRLHDSRIGKGGVYHLFRLPLAIEEILHNQLMGLDSSTFIPAIKDKNEALAQLQTLVDSTVDAPEGPVQIGTEKQIQRRNSIAELAKHYLDAFSNDKLVLPYFSTT